MASPLRRFPFFYGRKPERTLARPGSATLDLRSFVKRELGQNAQLIADDFFEAPAAGGGVIGTLSVTLAAVLLAGTGLVNVSGSGTPTLAAATLAGTGTVAVSGAGAATLGAATLSGSGAIAVAGSSSQMLGALSLTATGTVTTGSGADTVLLLFFG